MTAPPCQIASAYIFRAIGSDLLTDLRRVSQNDAVRSLPLGVLTGVNPDEFTAHQNGQGPNDR